MPAAGRAVVLQSATPLLIYHISLTTLHFATPDVLKDAGLERFDRSTGLGCVDFKGNRLNKIPTTAVPAASTPREGAPRADKPAKNQKPYPCLLTRAELKAIVAKQLG